MMPPLLYSDMRNLVTGSRNSREARLLEERPLTSVILATYRAQGRLGVLDNLSAVAPPSARTGSGLRAAVCTSDARNGK